MNGTRILPVVFLFSTLLTFKLSARGITPVPPNGQTPVSVTTIIQNEKSEGRSTGDPNTLNNVPCSPAISVTPTAYSICPNDSVQLIASGAVTYTWTPTTGLSCANCANPYAKPMVTTTYTVAGTNASSCIDSTTVTVTVGGIIVSIKGSKTSICQGNTDTLTASGANSYIWNTGATTSSIIINPSATFTYSVVGTSLTCQNSASFTVTVFPSPTITVTGNDSICAGGAGTTLVASGAVNYTWAPSSGLSCTSCPNPTADPSITTMYTIIGVDNNGCSGSATKTVYVMPPPSVSATISNRAPCSGVWVTLSANGSPAGGTYVWQPCNKTGQSVVDTPSTATIFTVTYSSVCGVVTDTVSVTIYPTPVVSFSSIFMKGCAPLCTQFFSRVSPAGIPISSYNWSFGPKDSSSLKNPTYCFENPGKYYVTLQVISGSCSGTGYPSDSIVVYAPPSVAFIYSPNPVNNLDPLVSFTNQSSDAYKIISNSWTFGDSSDSISYDEDPTHFYPDTGTFCVKLTVEDMHTCIDSSIQCIDIGTQYTFYIPSAFSPNNDGINDVFLPKGTDIRDFEMYIFDRWGVQLYHTKNILSGWNGSVNNGSKMCQEDEYVYVINITDTKDVEHHYTGAFTLVK